MSMDPSLKSASALVRHRNVLTRGERLARLSDQGKWDNNKSVFGLAKVGNRKLVVGKAKKEDGAEGAAPAAKGAAAKGAAAKGAAGAKGAAAKGAAAKGAAPAAKGAGKK